MAESLRADIRTKILDPNLLAEFTARSRTSEGKDSCLSFIPWRVVHSKVEESEEGDVDSKESTSSNGDSADRFSLPQSYLELRREQNVAWANQRLLEGISLAKDAKTVKAAEECYKQGLEVVPDHAPTHVAYGALLANRGKLNAALNMLEKALRIDPNCANAKKYKEEILRRRNRKEVPNSEDSRATLYAEFDTKINGDGTAKGNPNGEDGADEPMGDDPVEKTRIPGAAERSEKAMQDASLEHTILSGAVLARNDMSPHNASLANTGNIQYPLVFDEEQISMDSDSKRSSRKRKYGRRQQEQSHGSSSSLSDERKRERKRHRRRKRSKEKKRKKHKRSER